MLTIWNKQRNKKGSGHSQMIVGPALKEQSNQTRIYAKGKN